MAEDGKLDLDFLRMSSMWFSRRTLKQEEQTIQKTVTRQNGSRRQLRRDMVGRETGRKGKLRQDRKSKLRSLQLRMWWEWVG